MFEKHPRETSPDHLDMIRSKGCLVCTNPSDPHHLIQGGFGSDYLTVPLCRTHHTVIHSIGKTKFKVRYEIDVWKECALILEGLYLDLKKGEGETG